MSPKSGAHEGMAKGEEEEKGEVVPSDDDDDVSVSGEGEGEEEEGQGEEERLSTCRPGRRLLRAGFVRSLVVDVIAIVNRNAPSSGVDQRKASLHELKEIMSCFPRATAVRFRLSSIPGIDVIPLVDVLKVISEVLPGVAEFGIVGGFTLSGICGRIDVGSLMRDLKAACKYMPDLRCLSLNYECRSACAAEKFPSVGGGGAKPEVVSSSLRHLEVACKEFGSDRLAWLVDVFPSLDTIEWFWPHNVGPSQRPQPVLQIADVRRIDLSRLGSLTLWDWAHFLPFDAEVVCLLLSAAPLHTLRIPAPPWDDGVGFEDDYPRMRLFACRTQDQCDPSDPTCMFASNMIPRFSQLQNLTVRGKAHRTSLLAALSEVPQLRQLAVGPRSINEIASKYDASFFVRLIESLPLLWRFRMECSIANGDFRSLDGIMPRVRELDIHSQRRGGETSLSWKTIAALLRYLPRLRKFRFSHPKPLPGQSIEMVDFSRVEVLQIYNVELNLEGLNFLLGSATSLRVLSTAACKTERFCLTDGPFSSLEPNASLKKWLLSSKELHDRGEFENLFKRFTSLEDIRVHIQNYPDDGEEKAQELQDDFRKVFRPRMIKIRFDEMLYRGDCEGRGLPEYEW